MNPKVLYFIGGIVFGLFGAYGLAMAGWHLSQGRGFNTWTGFMGVAGAVFCYRLLYVALREPGDKRWE
jgi:hypothetical protein